MIPNVEPESHTWSWRMQRTWDTVDGLRSKCKNWWNECKQRVPHPVSPSFLNSPLIVSSIQAWRKLICITMCTDWILAFRTVWGSPLVYKIYVFFERIYQRKVTEKKEPIKLGSQFRLSDPTRGQSQQNPGGPPLQNDCACYTPLAYKLWGGTAYGAKM